MLIAAALATLTALALRATLARGSASGSSLVLVGLILITPKQVRERTG